MKLKGKFLLTLLLLATGCGRSINFEAIYDTKRNSGDSKEQPKTDSKKDAPPSAPRLPGKPPEHNDPTSPPEANVPVVPVEPGVRPKVGAPNRTELMNSFKRKISVPVGTTIYVPALVRQHSQNLYGISESLVDFPSYQNPSEVLRFDPAFFEFVGKEKLFDCSEGGTEGCSIEKKTSGDRLKIGPYSNVVATPFYIFKAVKEGSATIEITKSLCEGNSWCEKAKFEIDVYSNDEEKDLFWNSNCDNPKLLEYKKQHLEKSTADYNSSLSSLVEKQLQPVPRDQNIKKIFLVSSGELIFDAARSHDFYEYGRNGKLPALVKIETKDNSSYLAVMGRYYGSSGCSDPFSKMESLEKVYLRKDGKVMFTGGGSKQKLMGRCFSAKPEPLHMAICQAYFSVGPMLYKLDNSISASDLIIEHSLAPEVVTFTHEYSSINQETKSYVQSIGPAR